MSQMGKNVSKLVVLVFAAAVVVGITEVVVEAAPGDVRFTVNIPADAKCGSTSGSALAVVSGGKAGYPRLPVLLVTSCVPAAGSPPNLFLLDPFASPLGGTPPNYDALRVKTLATVFPATPPTNSLPGNLGWEAFVLRADSGDLLACGTNTVTSQTVLWSVDFSPFNTTNPEGTAAFLGNGPSGSSCNGIAWDPSDKTIYQTPAAIGAGVFHRNKDLTPAATPLIPSGCTTTSVSGLGVAGTSLLVGCEADVASATPSKIQQVSKFDGTLVPGRAFLGGLLPPDPAGLPDDPTTLASEYKELIWTLNGTLNASSPQILAVEIPGGTIGQLTGAPVQFPGVGSGANACPDTADNDGDGLLNCWEDSTLWDDNKPGISYNGTYFLRQAHANRDVTLCVTNPPVPTPGFQFPSECATKDNKDIFVEIDYMLNHYPDLTALGKVMDVFRLAPTPPGPVRLHIQLDDQITHNDTTALVPCTVPAAAGEADFDLIKFPSRPFPPPHVTCPDVVGPWGFGTCDERNTLSTINVLNAKALAFRYVLIAHNLSPSGNTTSGCSEIGGNDAIITLGSWGSVLVNGVQHNAGTTDQQAGTLLHELGHLLGLRHGGGDNINCKPNYVSVMNYTRQFDGSPVLSRQLDYSRGAYGVSLAGGVIGLDNQRLNEPNGINGGDTPLVSGGGAISVIKVAYGPPASGKLAVNPASTITSTPPGAGIGISWNRDLDIVDLNQSKDLTSATNSSGGCPALQKDAQGQVVHILEGFNDWEHLQFNFRGSLDFSGGSRDGFEQRNTVDDSEITLETALALSRWVIDAKSNDNNNTIRSSRSQTLNLTIFSGLNDAGTEIERDATTVDPESLTLRGTRGAPLVTHVSTSAGGKFQCNDKDVNKDTLVDRGCNFFVPAGSLPVGVQTLVLEGVTNPGGAAMLSSVTVNVIP